MLTPSAYNVTELLLAWRSGDKGALERLMPVVYQELRRLAEVASGERSIIRSSRRRSSMKRTCGSSVRVIRNGKPSAFLRVRRPIDAPDSGRSRAPS